MWIQHLLHGMILHQLQPSLHGMIQIVAQVVQVAGIHRAVIHQAQVAGIHLLVIHQVHLLVIQVGNLKF